MSSCVYTIKQGKRKGQECGKKVSKSDSSNQFCCAHLKSSQVSTDKLDKFHQSREEDDYEESEEDVGPFNQKTFSAPEVSVEDDSATDDDVDDVAELEDSCDDGIDVGFDMCEVIEHLQMMMKMKDLKQVKSGISQLLTYCQSS